MITDRKRQAGILGVVLVCLASWGTAATADSASIMKARPVPPRLSVEKGKYFAAHPAEWQAFLSKLPIPTAHKSAAKPGVPSPGTWTTLNNLPPVTEVSSPHLLTDGTVVVQQTCTGNWFQLTPDVNGSYINGTWAAIASLPSGYMPLYYASQVLNDGRLIINGGEYNNPGCGRPVWTNLGAVYDPAANTWTAVPAPPNFSNNEIGDAPSVVLPNGTYMLGDCCSTDQALLVDPVNFIWAVTGSGKFDVNNEEGWTLLPSGNLLTVDAYVFTGTCGMNTELYNTSAGTWSSAGNTPVQIADCGPPNFSFEVGPAVLRPNGTVVQFSAVTSGVAYTAIYNSRLGKWAKGPRIPAVEGQNYDLADAPAAWLPTGNILFAANPGLFQRPTNFFEFSNSSNIALDNDTTNGPFEPSFVVNLLVLPTGEVLQTDFTSNVQIYTPTGAVLSSVTPTITSVPTALTHGNSYSVTGRQLNGLGQGAAYGDDFQPDTNFPLVRITNFATGHVFYAKTSGFSTRSIAPNTLSTANFLVPAGIETGPSSLVVVANGVASTAVDVTIN